MNGSTCRAYPPKFLWDYWGNRAINKQPELDWRNPQTRALGANIIFSLLMLITTSVVAEYWRRHRTGPFQFGLRSLLGATTLVAVIVALLDNSLMHWAVLLAPFIAAGIVSLPAAVGLALDCSMRRSDRRLSRLRSRFVSS